MKLEDCISPMDFRYRRFDRELDEVARKYRSLDELSKIKKIMPELLLPRLASLEDNLLNIAVENKGKKVPKRIDGRHAGKTTVDNIFGIYAERLNYRIHKLKIIPLDLKELEESKRNDRLADIVYAGLSTLGVEANIADDIRQLHRSEIEEVGWKDYGKERIGSSTMPHKQNPVEYENIVGFYKATIPMMTTALFALITEHQGDSRNDDLAGHVFEMLSRICYTTFSLDKALKNLEVKV